LPAREACHAWLIEGSATNSFATVQTETPPT